MLRVVLSLVFALSVVAQGRITLDPPAPTSRTPIEARVFVVCQEESHTVNRVGNVLKIHVLPGPEICDPPIPSLVSVSLGTLPAGEYRIEVTVGNLDSIPASRTFVVREGATREGTVHPFAVPTQPAGLLLRLDSHRLAESPCGPDVTGPCRRIFVDGTEVPAGSITEAADGALWFPAPAHAPGLVPVSMSFAGGETRTIVDGLYFYDRGVPPELSVFERVLFPVLFSSRGGHGSEWLSEAAIANPRPWYVETVNEVMPFVCITYPCGERMAPSSTVAFDGMGYPQGVALIVPRAEADDLTFSLRVRDTARHAEGYGTQIPVVRESDMFRNAELTLLDLPVDPRYRTKIRMYVFDSGDHDAYVTVRQAHGVIDTRFVPVRRDCTSGDCAEAPWYGELDLTAGNTGDRVDVYITIGGTDTPAWAFASVTNNDTQQVTIVTPDGAGGRPGPDYEVWR